MIDEQQLDEVARMAVKTGKLYVSPDVYQVICGMSEAPEWMIGLEVHSVGWFSPRTISAIEVEQIPDL